MVSPVQSSEALVWFSRKSVSPREQVLEFSGYALCERLRDRFRLVDIEPVHTHFECRVSLLDHQTQAGSWRAAVVHVVRIVTDATYWFHRDARQCRRLAGSKRWTAVLPAIVLLAVSVANFPFPSH